MSSAPSTDLALFHRTLAEMCRSELPLPRALRTIEADLAKSPLKDAVRAMADDVESGTSVADAYAAHASRFPPLYRALVEAGSAAGDLPAVLEEIAEHATRRDEIATRLRRALAYPMLTAGFVVVIGTVLLVFVAPQFAEMSATVTAHNPLFGASDSVMNVPWFGLGALLSLLTVAALSIATFMWLRNPMDGAVSGGASRYRVPVIGPLRYDADVAAFASTLALLVRRRMPLPRALDLAAEVTESGPLRRVALAAADAAHEGGGIADSARAAGLFAPSLLWIVEAAERRGDAADALDDVARIYRQRLTRAVDRASVVVTPAAELVLGATVLLLTYSFLAPILELTRRLCSRS